jgi:hypothetical protein
LKQDKASGNEFIYTVRKDAMLLLLLPAHYNEEMWTLFLN